MKKFLTLMFLSILLITLYTFSVSANIIELNEDTIYVFDKSRNEFVPEEDYHSYSLKNGALTTQATPSRNITIDGNAYSIKVLNCTLNQAESNLQPYTQMNKIMTLAYGQTQKVSNTTSISSTHMTSTVKKKNSGFSIGADGSVDKKTLEKNLLGKLVEETTSILSFGVNYSHSSSYQSTDITKTVKRESHKITDTYGLPTGFNPCNSMDFYTFNRVKVYDVELILKEEFTTTDPAKGYVNVVNTSMTPTYDDYDSNQFLGLKCNHCGAYDDVGPGLDNVVHVEFKDGHVKHFDKFEFEVFNSDIYKPYNENNSTKLTCKYYLPELLGKAIAYRTDEPNTLNLSAPVELVAKGSEEIVWSGGTAYLYRVIDSKLTEPYHCNIPGTQIRNGVIINGQTREIEFTKENYCKTSFEEIHSSSSNLSANVKFKLFKWLSLSGGGHHSTETIDTTYNDEERTIILYDKTTFKYPSVYGTDYDCITIKKTLDIFSYEVRCEIIPYDAYGNLQNHKKMTVTFKIEKEYPKIYSNPEKL